MPLLSIITINRNNAQGLKKTIESVVKQTETDFNDIEYIIIDGNSTDGSKDIIKEFAGNPEYKDKITYWLSEPDTGIYNAMNKGIKKATGDYCLFLNSGDYLVENNLHNVLAFAKVNKDADIIYSDIPEYQGYKKLYFPKTVDENYFIETTICHQNSLIKRILFKELGFYSEELKIVSDWRFWLVCAKKNKNFLYLENCIAYLDRTGLSNQETSQNLIMEERRKTIKELYPGIYKTIFELIEYKSSTYGNIIKLFGNSKSLEFILKTYRWFARRLVKNDIKKNKKQNIKI